MNTMANLIHRHEITEVRDFGVRVLQVMQIIIEYNPRDSSIDIRSCSITQDGKFIAEISKLLHKAEGNPLCTILENINWQEIYQSNPNPELINKHLSPYEIFQLERYGNILNNESPAGEEAEPAFAHPRETEIIFSLLNPES